MTTADAPRRRLLDPTDRFSEILFGLIMVLTFTGTLSVAEAGRQEVREMLVGALGCNLAWGIVDAIMFLISSLTLRARGHTLLRALQAATDKKAAAASIAEVLPERLAAVLLPEDLESMRRRLAALPAPPAKVMPSRQEWLQAVAICVLVFLSTFPVTIPFMFIHDAHRALRLSNAVALVMLFLLGHSLGKYAGGRPWLLGLGMLVLGLALVGLTIVLGG
ncbi:MAG TPA: VIT1/CCC1 transporter family protein [Candidatus Polarisedimenticolaceae bacterium]|nr:VIT1/CCC1 transporter family protein [Candidatus Polarisedimenticolaceae bacterium]